MTSCIHSLAVAEASGGPAMAACAFESAARHAADQIVLRHDYGADGRILSANSLFCDVTGFRVAEIVGQTHTVIKPALGQPWVGLHQETVPNSTWAGETVVTAKDGRDIWLNSIIQAVRAPDGAVIGYSCVSIDVTEAVRVRDELRRHGKLMQLGQLTATVAHEIRNPLGAIRTASFVLERKIGGKLDGVAPQLDRINTGIQRCDKIISELLDVSRIKTLKAQQLPVDTWIHQTISEDCNGLPGDPDIQYRLGLTGCYASFDPDQMRQVIINLLSNAAEAMGEKSKADTSFRPVIVVSSRMSGTCVEISVADNGPGISPKNLARVREPLFTTKSFGVGLGIPAMERILENHGGYLQISSDYGSGATVVAGFDRGLVDGFKAEAA